jgi:hypothetical protein
MIGTRRSFSPCWMSSGVVTLAAKVIGECAA